MKRIAMCLALTLLSACETMQAIDTALYAVTDSVTQTDKVTGGRVVSKDRDTQIATGNAPIEAMLAMADEAGDLYNEDYDAEAYARIVKIFDKIHSVSHLKDEDWEVLLLPSNSFNAFVTGGTYIVVYSGLENELQNDAELAAVLGHEFAHVAANHIGEKKGHKQFATLLGSNSVKRSSFEHAFTHEDEEEADEIGILYTALAGYDPYGAHRVWQRKYLELGDNANIFVDHPIYSERAQQTQSTAEKVVQYYASGQINSDHEALLKDNSIFSFQETADSKGGDWSGIAAVLTASLESYTKHQLAKIEEDRQRYRINTLNAVNNLLKVINIDQLSSNQWKILVEYSGNRKIGGLQFQGALYQGQQKLATFQATSGGTWMPSSRYYVTATTQISLPNRTKVTAYKFKTTEVKVY